MFGSHGPSKWRKFQNLTIFEVVKFKVRVNYCGKSENLEVKLCSIKTKIYKTVDYVVSAYRNQLFRVCDVKYWHNTFFDMKFYYRWEVTWRALSKSRFLTRKLKNATSNYHFWENFDHKLPPNSGKNWDFKIWFFVRKSFILKLFRIIKNNESDNIFFC